MKYYIALSILFLLNASFYTKSTLGSLCEQEFSPSEIKVVSHSFSHVSNARLIQDAVKHILYTWANSGIDIKRFAKYVNEYYENVMILERLPKESKESISEDPDQFIVNKFIIEDFINDIESSPLIQAFIRNYYSSEGDILPPNELPYNGQLKQEIAQLYNQGNFFDLQRMFGNIVKQTKQNLFRHLLSTDIRSALLEYLEQMEEIERTQHILEFRPEHTEWKEAIVDRGSSYIHPQYLFAFLKAVIKKMPDPILKASIFDSFHKTLFQETPIGVEIERAKRTSNGHSLSL